MNAGGGDDEVFISDQNGVISQSFVISLDGGLGDDLLVASTDTLQPNQISQAVRNIRTLNDLQQRVEQLLSDLHTQLIEGSKNLLDSAYNDVVLGGEGVRTDATQSVLTPANSAQQLANSVLAAGKTLKDLLLGPDDISGLAGSIETKIAQADQSLTDAGDALVALEESQTEVPDIDFDSDDFNDDNYGDIEPEDLPAVDGSLNEIDDLADSIENDLNASVDGDAVSAAADIGLSAQADSLAAMIDNTFIPSTDAFLARSDAYLAGAVSTFDSNANGAYMVRATTVMNSAASLQTSISTLVGLLLNYLEGTNDDPSQGTAACEFEFNTTNTVNDLFGSNIFIGSNGNDEMNGSDDSDFMFGRGGRDKIKGGKDFDFIYGGAGSDSLMGEDGFDVILGGGDHDAIDGADGGP